MSAIRIKIKSKPGVGYNVSHSERKTKRVFLPNNQTFRFLSKILGKTVVLYCKCKIYKLIMRFGDLDRYLICNKNVLLELSGIKKEISQKIKKINFKTK